MELKARQWAHVHLQRYGIRVFLICVGSGLLSVWFVLDAVLLGSFLGQFNHWDQKNVEPSLICEQSFRRNVIEVCVSRGTGGAHAAAYCHWLGGTACLASIPVVCIAPKWF